MKTRIVYTDIWDKEWFVIYSKSGKILFLYLITNSKINLSGIFMLTDRQMTFDTGLTNSELVKAKSEISNKIVFYKNWVRVPKSKEYGGYTGEKNEIAMQKELLFVPIDVKKYFNRYCIDRVSEKTDTSINHKSKIINHKSKEKFIPPTIDEIKEYITKNNYTVNADTFYKYFNEGKWVDSNGKKVRNWKQKIITWNGRDKKRETKKINWSKINLKGEGTNE